MRGVGCQPSGLGMPWGYLAGPQIWGNEVPMHGHPGFMGHYAAVHGHPGFLGDDPTAGVDFSGAVDINSAPLDTSSLTAVDGILSPTAPPVTVDQLNTYVTTGQADPSVLGQLATLVSAAGPAVNSILQQVQFGQLAANTPISSLAALRAAVAGAPGSASSIISSLTADPMFLVLGAGLLFLLLRKKGG